MACLLFLKVHIACIPLSDWVHWNFEWWKWAPILTLGHAVTPMMIWSLRRKLAVFWHLSQLLEVHSAQLALLSCCRRLSCSAAAHRRRGVSRRTAAVRLHLFSSKLLQHSTIIWSRKKSWPLLEICHDYCPSKAAILSAALCWEMSKRKWPNWLASSSRARSSKARVATKRSWIGARVRTEGAGVRHCTVQWIINHIIFTHYIIFSQILFCL